MDKKFFQKRTTDERRSAQISERILVENHLSSLLSVFTPALAGGARVCGSKTLTNSSCHLPMDLLGFLPKTLTLPSPSGRGESRPVNNDLIWGVGELLKSR